MLDAQVAHLAALAHLPEDKVRCLTALLATYPLALPLLWHPRRKVDPASGRPLPAPQWAVTLKHAYMLATALLLATFCFPRVSDRVHLVAGPLAVYALVRVGAKWAKTPRFVSWVWAFVLLHMSYSHLIRQLTDWGGYRFDHTAPQMVLVLKLTSFAWAVRDKLFTRDAAKLSDRQRRMMVDVPGLLEFAAYALFPAGLLVGPAFEFADFQRWVSGDVFLEDAGVLSGVPALAAPADAPVAVAAKRARFDSAMASADSSDAERSDAERSDAGDIDSLLAAGDRLHTPAAAAAGGGGGGLAAPKYPATVAVRVPSPVLPALRAFLTSVVFMIGVVLYADAYAFSRLLTPAYLAPASGVCELARRFLRLQMSGAVARFQYYAVWRLAEGACRVSGLAYNGKGKWDRVTNVRIAALESATSFKGILDNWNIGTANWLKHSVYLRLTPPGTKPTPLTTIATYGTSAVWHGFYAGYYMTFFTGAIITETAKSMRRTLRPLLLTSGRVPQPVYNALGWLSTQAVLNYVVAPFLLLSWQDSWAVWRANAFVGHLGLLVVMAACQMLAPAAKRAARAHGAAHKHGAHAGAAAAARQAAASEVPAAAAAGVPAAVSTSVAAANAAVDAMPKFALDVAAVKRAAAEDELRRRRELSLSPRRRSARQSSGDLGIRSRSTSPASSAEGGAMPRGAAVAHS